MGLRVRLKCLVPPRCCCKPRSEGGRISDIRWKVALGIEPQDRPFAKARTVSMPSWSNRRSSGKSCIKLWETGLRLKWLCKPLVVYIHHLRKGREVYGNLSVYGIQEDPTGPQA